MQFKKNILLLQLSRFLSCSKFFQVFVTCFPSSLKQEWCLKKVTTFSQHNIPALKGGFHVVAKIIRELKSHMILYKFKCSHCTLIHGYIKSPNLNFVFWLQSLPYDLKIGPHQIKNITVQGRDCNLNFLSSYQTKILKKQTNKQTSLTMLSGSRHSASCFSTSPEVPNLWNVHLVIRGNT